MENQTAVVSAASIDVELEIVTPDAIIAAHKSAVDCTWAVMDAGTKFIEKAAECGRLLIAKKAEVGHGKWLDWLAENIKEFCYDTANDYMKAARYMDRGPNMDATSLRQIRDLRQVVSLLDDKPPSAKEHEKPAFVIRCAFNVAPETLDEHQRKDAFDRAKPLLRAFETFGFIEIKA